MVAEKTIDPADLDRLIVSDDPGEVVSGDHGHGDEAVRADLRPEGEAALVAAGEVREVVEPTAAVNRNAKSKSERTKGAVFFRISLRVSIFQGRQWFR